MSLQEELYWVNARNLTPRDLRLSNLPDDSLENILVKFKSKRGIDYTVDHTIISRSSYILLLGYETLHEDLESVKEIILAKTGGVIEKQPKDTDYVEDVVEIMISLSKRLKQARIAVFVESYGNHFDEVTIRVARFKNVPKKYIDKPGLPSDKFVYGRMGIDDQPLTY